MIQLIRGFKDILPEETSQWQHIEKTVRTLFEDFGFREIRPPILEKTELFKRSIGEDTDIVEKEMYTFEDRNGGLLTLRPEATASVVRSYIQHKMYATDPVQKMYTIGPMFRRERPQKGRYRQFYQINAEVFGIESPLIDAQLIFMLVNLFSRLSVTGINVHLNSLGCPECRPNFKKILSDFLALKKTLLCENCVRRSSLNPMRVLDCKVPSCREAVSEAPSIIDSLCSGCRRHFEAVSLMLEKQGVRFEVDKRLVRGLDYYTRTTFEIQTGELGAQSAVAGGGRYDGLVEALGGPSQPAIGFAIGFDRLLEILPSKEENRDAVPEIFVAALGDECITKAYLWATDLSMAGISSEIDLTGRSLKSLMKRADRLNAVYVLIVGEDELKKGKVILRNMETKEQHSVSIKGIVENIRNIINQ
jgi:histidyl-tRNA synthetase